MNVVQQPPTEQSNAQMAQLALRVKSGSGWFLWIAGLSLINTIAAAIGVNWSFCVGLCVTQIMDALGNEIAAAKGLAVVVNLVIVGVYALFGVQARKNQSWAFITGLILYALDTIALVLLGFASGSIGEAGISIVFHGLALAGIAGGIKANSALKATIAEQAGMAYLSGRTQTDYTSTNYPGGPAGI